MGRVALITKLHFHSFIPHSEKIVEGLKKEKLQTTKDMEMVALIADLLRLGKDISNK